MGKKYPSLSLPTLWSPVGVFHWPNAQVASSPGSLVMDGELGGNLSGTEQAGQGERRCTRAGTASVSADKTVATVRNQKIFFN